MSNSGKIKKSKQTERFTTIPNSILEDQRISLKAIGLLCYILRLPPDWILHKTKLHDGLKDGRDSVLAAFKELEGAGYIDAEEVREAGKFSGYNYTVYDNPMHSSFSEDAPITEITVTGNTESVELLLPITDIPESDKPKTEKPKLKIKNKTKKTNNQTSSPSGEVAPEEEPKKISLYAKFIEIYWEWHLKEEGFPPKIDGIQGKAAKALIGYFKIMIRRKMQETKQIETEYALDEGVLASLRYILNGWGFVPTWCNDGISLSQINSRIQLIIKHIKDGYAAKNKSTGSESGDQASAAMQIIYDRRNAGSSATDSNRPD